MGIWEVRFCMKKRILYTVFIMLFLLIFSSCNDQQNYVAIVDGEKISVPEFKVYLYIAQQEFENIGDTDIWDTSFEAGVTAEEIAKERALDSLAHVKISAKQAKKMNIYLTEDEKESAQKDATDFLNNLNENEIQAIGISESNMTEIMEQKILYKKVKDEITKNFELSQRDFENSYKDYVSKNDSLTEESLANRLVIQYIFFSTDVLKDDSVQRTAQQEKDFVLEKAQLVLEKARSGQDFTQLVIDYSDDRESVEKEGKEIIEKGKYIEQVEKVAFGLKKGEISDLIELDGNYYIIKLVDIVEPVVKEQYRVKYINTKKDEIFEQEYSNWSSKEPEKNVEVWDTIKKID